MIPLDNAKVSKEWKPFGSTPRLTNEAKPSHGAEQDQADKAMT
jgi:hypothetical protein